MTGDSMTMVAPAGLQRGACASRQRSWRPGVPGALRGHRDFTLLWAGQAVSQLGTRIFGVAYMLWVLAVTGSVSRTGVIGSVTLGAFALAQLPGGWLADRLDRRRIVVACDASSAVAALSLCAAAAAGWFNMAQVLLATVVLGIGWGVRGTAESASLADVLPAEELAGAGALISARGHAAGLAGPTVASSLFRLSPALPFLVDGVSYLVALVCGASVRTPLRTPPRPGPTRAPRVEILEGMRAFWNARFIRLSVALDSAAAFASNALALVVIVALRNAHASPSAIGLALGMGSVGGLAGAALAASLHTRLRSPLSVLVAAPGLGATAIASLAFATSTAGIALSFGTFFLLWPAWSAVLTAEFFRRVDPGQRGRVGGTAGLLGAVSVAAAPAATGALLPTWGTRTTCLALAGVLAAVALAASVARALREAPQTSTAQPAVNANDMADNQPRPATEQPLPPATQAQPGSTRREEPVTAAKLPEALLLRGPLHESVQPPECMDFQVRVGRPHADASRGPRPCVLVTTRTADREIDDLSMRLAAGGIPMVRLDSDRAADQALLWDPTEGVLTTSEGSFRPVVAWPRYFTPGSVPVAADPQMASYQREQWSAWASIPTSAHTVSVVNRDTGPGRPDRVNQLAEARAVGLRAPATIVTSAPWVAARMLPGEGDVIVKALGEHYIEPRPGHLIGLAPRRISRAALAGQRVEPAPVMVQEFLPSIRELRIYLVAGDLITYAITKPSPESLWNGDPGVYARAVPTPSGLDEPLTRLAEGWNLDVAAFDLLDTEDGHVFLEVNSACDWLWTERLAGNTLVSRRVAELVSAKFDAACSAGAGPNLTAALAGAI